MNLQVPPELEARLTRLAAETGRTASQVSVQDSQDEYLFFANFVDCDERLMPIAPAPGQLVA